MKFKSIFIVTPLFFSLVSCNPPEQDPVSSLNGLAKDYGFIGLETPLENSSTGTLVSGRPKALAFVAHANDCFPADRVGRHLDRSDFNRKYSYTFQGNLGFMTSGTPIVSAGLSLKNDHFVNIELSGITIEYMSSIDISNYYMDGMDETCRQYLDDVGFIIQSLSSEKFTMSIKKISGNSIGLNADNIGQYFQFNFGVDWQMVDEYTVEVTTPKYLGYQLGRLRLEDDGRTLYRAMTVDQDKFVFEPLHLFDETSGNNKSLVQVNSSELDDNSYFE